MIIKNFTGVNLSNNKYAYALNELDKAFNVKIEKGTIANTGESVKCNTTSYGAEIKAIIDFRPYPASGGSVVVVDDGKIWSGEPAASCGPYSQYTTNPVYLEGFTPYGGGNSYRGNHFLVDGATLYLETTGLLGGLLVSLVYSFNGTEWTHELTANSWAPATFVKHGSDIYLMTSFQGGSTYTGYYKKTGGEWSDFTQMTGSDCHIFFDAISFDGYIWYASYDTVTGANASKVYRSASLSSTFGDDVSTGLAAGDNPFTFAADGTSLFVFTFDGSTNVNAYIWNGSSWVSEAASIVTGAGALHSGTTSYVTLNGDLYVGLCSGLGVGVKRTSGGSWSDISYASGGSSDAFTGNSSRLTHAGSDVIIAGGTYLAESSDGTTWTEGTAAWTMADSVLNAFFYGSETIAVMLNSDSSIVFYQRS